jgi:hypothetical protein
MHPKQAVGIGVRLFAIWLGFSMAAMMWRMSMSFNQGRMAFEDILFLVLLLTGIGICLALWFFPLTVAGFLLPKAERKPEEIPLAANEYFEIGCRLIALWVLTTALPSLIYNALLRIAANYEANQTAWNAADNLNITYSLAQCGIAIWLLFGARGLKRLIERARR